MDPRSNQICVQNVCSYPTIQEIVITVIKTVLLTIDRGHCVIYGVESWSGVLEWSHGVESWSGFWSGMKSDLQ